MLTYREKLLDPRWQRKRLEVLARAEFRCDMCSDDRNTLHVHHRRYIKGRNPWEYDDRDLVAFCENCHLVAHSEREMIERVLVQADPGAISEDQLGALLAGYLSLANPGSIDVSIRAWASRWPAEYSAGKAAAKAAKSFRLTERGNE